MDIQSNSAIGRLRKNRSGAVAVEFAMILPAMLLFYLGTFEGSQVIMANRKVSAAAETLGGIVARSTAMDTTRIKNAFLVSDAVLAPLDLAPLSMTVTAVKVDTAGKATVDWSRKDDGPGLAVGSSYSLPDDLVGLADAYYVFSTASYDYAPLFGYEGVVTPMRMERTFTFRPRKGSSIPWS
jgi:Flp pilus assembly protein TadG